MTSILLFILLLYAVVYCLMSNRDLFSPAKLYHLFLCIFFIDIFLSNYDGYVYVVYVIYIVLGIIMSTLEQKNVKRPEGQFHINIPEVYIPPKAHLKLWIISLIPIIAQLYLIDISGGLGTFDKTVALRIREWQGLGYIRIWTKLFPILNLTYYSIGLLSRKSLGWWFLYTVHFAMFCIFALLSGSRGFLLCHIFYMIMLYHYLKRNINLRTAAVVSCFFLIFACFLGAFRQNIVGKVDTPFVAINESLNKPNLMLFKYGLIPLDMIFEGHFNDYQYGKTFASAITNFIPRHIWPGKYDSGGVVLTRFFHGYAYIGTSHYSTGLVTESILNFGYTVGIPFSFVMFIFIIHLNVKLYTYCLRQMCRLKSSLFLFVLIVYPTLVSLTGAMLYSEFSHLVSALLTRCLFVLIVVACLQVRLGSGVFYSKLVR